MKLIKPNFTFDRSHYSNITSNNINVEFQKISRKISPISLNVSPDNPLSPYYSSANQLIIFNSDYSFQVFDSVGQLFLYAKLILSGLNQEEALVSLTKNIDQPNERFDKRRAELMFKFNLLKFYQNYELAFTLFETGDNYLQVESNSTALGDNLFGKILMLVRYFFKTTMGEDQLDKVSQSNKRRISDLNLLDYADEISWTKVNDLYNQIENQNLVEKGRNQNSIIIGQCNPLSHHFEGGSENTQITIMTHDFDLWMTTSAIRLYGAVKLMLNGRSKDYSYRYLDPSTSKDKKYIDEINDGWRSRDVEIAFKANLLRYLQNPDVAQILVRTGEKRLLPSSYSKLSETTVQMHMIIRHILNSHDLCLNTNAIKIEDCLSL